MFSISPFYKIQRFFFRRSVRFNILHFAIL
jgi:hypothetical protein